MAIISSLGMIISLTLYPHPLNVPGIVLVAILLLALTSMAGNKPVGGFAFIVAITWTLINYSAVVVNNAVTNLNKNPYIDYNPVILITISKIFFAALPLIAMIAMWRLKENKKEVCSINDEEEKTNPITAIIEAYNTRRLTKKFEWLDLEICKNIKTNQPVILKGLDRYLHLLISGTTGTGKTSRCIKPWILQDLMRIKSGHKMSIVVVEPSGDLAQDVADLCKKLDIPCVHVDPMNPNTAKFNILQGNATDVAETTRTVLKELFGKQDAFFSQVQETAARNTILLLKRLYGDDMDLTDVVRTLRDIKRLELQVNKLKEKEGDTDLVQYFENELLAGEMRDKYKQFAIGLRQQLEDIVGNDRIKNVITGNSSIDLDELLAEGGVFVVNSALELGTVGDTFGKFVIGQMKAAIWRRPGNENTRIPCVFKIDEFPVYVNDDFRRLLGIGRKYRVIITLAVQTLDDIELKGGKVLANIFMQNCRNKVVFGGMTGSDAKRWEEEFGTKEIEERQASYDNKVVVPAVFAKGYRVVKKEIPRIPYTKLMEMKEFQFIYRLVKDARLQPPGQGKGSLINIDKIKNTTKTISVRKKIEKYKEKKTDNLVEKVINTVSELKSSVKEIKNIRPVIEVEKKGVIKKGQTSVKVKSKPKVPLEETNLENTAIMQQVQFKPKTKIRFIIPPLSNEENRENAIKEEFKAKEMPITSVPTNKLKAHNIHQEVAKPEAEVLNQKKEFEAQPKKEKPKSKPLEIKSQEPTIEEEIQTQEFWG